MKKLAFSVWPELPNDISCPQSLLDRSSEREGILADWGFEFRHVSRCDHDDVAKTLFERYTKKNVRKATSISDYIRVAEMVYALEKEGYDEVFYLDYDFHCWSKPTGYGVPLQCNLQPDDNGDPVKLWYRGINCAYYLGKHHLPILKRHLQLLRNYIISKDYNPAYCYPMNFLAEIEETVGYIPGYWLLGSFVRTNSYCPEYVEKLIHLAVYAGDMPEKGFIRGMNLMGSDYDTENGFQAEQKRAEEIKDKLEREFPYFSLEEIREELAGVRLRPNYNSLGKRQELKQILGRIK
jgi:hypothetical protein